ncbi:hypothetical protein ABVT39_022974 [Epinephelus coioides]
MRAEKDSNNLLTVSSSGYLDDFIKWFAFCFLQCEQICDVLLQRARCSLIRSLWLGDGGGSGSSERQIHHDGALHMCLLSPASAENTLQGRPLAHLVECVLWSDPGVNMLLNNTIGYIPLKLMVPRFHVVRGALRDQYSTS